MMMKKKINKRIKNVLKRILSPIFFFIEDLKSSIKHQFYFSLLLFSTGGKKKGIIDKFLIKMTKFEQERQKSRQKTDAQLYNDLSKGEIIFMVVLGSIMIICAIKAW